jgi:hypothetical protein
MVTLIPQLALIAFTTAVVFSIAVCKRSMKILGIGALFAITYVFLDVLLLVPVLSGFIPDLQWNWVGKTLVIFGVIIAIRFIPFLNWGAIGVKAPKCTSHWFYGVSVGFAFVVFLGVVLWFSGASPKWEWFSLNTVLFQLFMPSIAEELSTRGVLLAILNAAIPSKQTFAGLRFNMALVIVSLAFVLEHTLGFSQAAGLYWSYGLMDTAFLTVVSISLGLLRVHTESLYPCMIAHSMVNLGLGSWS